MPRLKRFLRDLPLLIVLPVLLVVVALALAIADLFWIIAGRRRRPVSSEARSQRAASVVIPTWNGRDLLEKFLPSVVSALEGNPENEIIVVDNGSSDGSAELLREAFPGVRVLALERNLGFGGGSNAGVRAAKNDIVVLLNSDMRVAPDFLAPLLEGFAGDSVFSVSSQIFFGDSTKRREETGLTQGWWRDGGLRVRHRIDAAITGLYPCFYGGGGSSAYDRRKFLELGGFDPLFAPFYLEDTELGFMAWKRGWQVLYQPRSIVFHEHRGTIGKRYAPEQVAAVLKKNFALFAWKNIHNWRKLAGHFFFAVIGAGLSAVFGDAPERTNAMGLVRAFTQLPGALASRWRARSLAMLGDDEAFRRPLAGYYRDRFELAGVPASETARPQVLFVSPYPICPPVHGGAVFMYAAVRELARHCDVHLVCLLDLAREREPHRELERFCASAEFLVRVIERSAPPVSIVPHAISEFRSDELGWLLHRQVFTRKIDIVQLEYTALAQYLARYRRIGEFLFEHDIYFQSVARGLRERRPGPAKAVFEYLRALRYELRALGAADRLQVCTAENREYLLSFAPKLAARTQHGLRAVVDASAYEFRTSGREPATMLFLGSFRHLPNHAALDWFVREVLPRVLERRPEARLVVVGSDAPPRSAFPMAPAIEMRGLVEDIRDPLGRYAVFVCPILSGSGVRVKLLEAFAAGIPVVSTRIGAEGLARRDGDLCALADTPVEFAEKILDLFENPAVGEEMARRARAEIERDWDAAAVTPKLVESYRQVLREKRGRARAGATSSE